MNKNSRFYNKLVRLDISLADLLGNEQLFEQVPADWQIIVADVEKSTQAVSNGLHQEVNLAATGSIIAVINKLKEIDAQFEIPYFFGGDGATFLLPTVFLQPVLTVLENFRHHVQRNLYLNLKVGALPVDEVYKANHTVKIAKFKVNSSLTIPIVLGGGLKSAEKEIKSHFIDESEGTIDFLPVNLEGMECRWKEIAPPANEDQIVCLLVDSLDEASQGRVYQSITIQINKTFGKFQERHPLSTSKMKLDLNFQRIKKEMFAKVAGFNLGYLIKNWLITILGKFYFIYFKGGKSYVKKLIERSHSIMIDGTFNTVISGTQVEIDQLVDFLDDLESRDIIRYGIHVTHGSILSCYVQDRKAKHTHFVDGTGGGYTTASKMFKAKLD